MTTYKTGDAVWLNGRPAVVVGQANKKCYFVREQEWGPDVEPASVHQDWLKPAAPPARATRNGVE